MGQKKDFLWAFSLQRKRNRIKSGQKAYLTPYQNFPHNPETYSALWEHKTISPFQCPSFPKWSFSKKYSSSNWNKKSASSLRMKSKWVQKWDVSFQMECTRHERKRTGLFAELYLSRNEIVFRLFTSHFCSTNRKWEVGGGGWRRQRNSWQMIKHQHPHWK